VRSETNGEGSLVGIGELFLLALPRLVPGELDSMSVLGEWAGAIQAFVALLSILATKRRNIVAEQ